MVNCLFCNKEKRKWKEEEQMMIDEWTSDIWLKTGINPKDVIKTTVCPDCSHKTIDDVWNKIIQKTQEENEERMKELEKLRK